MRNIDFKSVVSSEWSVRRVMRKVIAFWGVIFLLFTFNFCLHAQPNSDNLYARPLKEVLNDVQKSTA